MKRIAYDGTHLADAAAVTQVLKRVHIKEDAGIMSFVLEHLHQLIEGNSFAAFARRPESKNSAPERDVFAVEHMYLKLIVLLGRHGDRISGAGKTARYRDRDHVGKASLMQALETVKHFLDRGSGSRRDLIGEPAVYYHRVDVDSVQIVLFGINNMEGEKFYAFLLTKLIGKISA